ncbi:MAG: methyltransferase domain-containing protein [Acidobacteriaceae bacterium]|nr:methyltransferase domain-containing protein [Acidobacteriaceae bacterium]
MVLNLSSNKRVSQTVFDVVYARFLLTHLPHPEHALARMHRVLRPGGILIVQDIDFRGYFSEPDSPAFWRYVDLHIRAMQRRGGDPNIGLRLPALLEAAGFADVQMNLVQPAATRGEVKLITPITMENIADAVESEGLATRAELERLTDELYEFAHMPGTIGCIPRVIEAWGYTRLKES